MWFLCFLVLTVVVVALGFFSFAAIGATSGLVGESLFYVERLLAFGKDEFFVAIFANECFIGHSKSEPPLNIWTRKGEEVQTLE